MPDPDTNGGLPGVPDGTDTRSGGDREARLHMDVQDSGGVFLVGSVPADSLTEAMDVMANIVIAEEVYDQRVRERSFEIVEALAAELLSRSRMIHGG